MYYFDFNRIPEAISNWIEKQVERIYHRPLNYKEDRWRYFKKAYYAILAVSFVVGILIIAIQEEMQTDVFSLVAIFILPICIYVLYRKEPLYKVKNYEAWWRGELPVRAFWTLGAKRWSNYGF